MSMRLEKMDRLERNKPRVYALIIGQLSQESPDKVRQMPNWDTFDNEGDGDTSNSFGCGHGKNEA